MASLLATTGGYVLPLGLPGNPASSSPHAINTWVNEGTTGTQYGAGGIDGLGTIDFGVAVAKGSADNGAVPFSATNSSQRIVGISSRLPLMSATLPNNIIGYPTNTAFGVYRFGDVVVIAAEAVNEGDGVVALSTVYRGNTIGTSNLGSAVTANANGTTRIAMSGHRWKTSAVAGGLAIIEIIGGETTVTS